jgi:hypothetical protein
MTEIKKYDASKIKKPWLDADAPATVEKSYPQPPTAIEQNKPSRKHSSKYLYLSAVGIAGAVTAIVMLGIVLVFGVTL